MYLVTGITGFIGFHTAQALLERGEAVLGIDNVNSYYDPELKHGRLKTLQSAGGNLTFIQQDIADYAGMQSALKPYWNKITHIIHLAAQAGVRYSLEAPFSYTESNVTGQLTLLELARNLPNIQHMVYASSSSVYGANTKTPFSIEDKTDNPVSLYAATKKAGEMLAESYSRLYTIPLTGLRFFTVYGPWGRPDMAYFKFTKAILAGKTIDVYNHGKMRRDFTYIDDIVQGILAAAGHVPTQSSSGTPPHRVYNLGNHQCEELMDMIRYLEAHLNIKANINMMPMQPGDMVETYADIDASNTALGYTPSTQLKDGLKKFVDWYREYYQ